MRHRRASAGAAGSRFAMQRRRGVSNISDGGKLERPQKLLLMLQSGMDGFK